MIIGSVCPSMFIALLFTLLTDISKKNFALQQEVHIYRYGKNIFVHMYLC